MSSFRSQPSALSPSRRGQAIIFLLMVLVILFFVVIWNFDLHGILHIKSITQNAGDSASLMAARWQGITLNVIGDLNVMQALALSVDTEDTEDTCLDINDIQARLCYVGPMIGFMASQQAAKQNGIYRNEDFDAILLEHADAVRNDYPTAATADGEMLFPEPFPGCWPQYADMLDLIANEGVAAGPDNASLYTDGVGGHILLEVGFYQAIAGLNWCWWYHHAPTLLEDYENFFPCWWPALPEPEHRFYMNSEIYGLGLTKRTTTLDGMIGMDEMQAAAEEREFEDAMMTSTGMVAEATWYCYGGKWGEWEIMSINGSAGHFPITGSVKDKYNYVGADAAVRVQGRMDRLTPGPGGSQVRNTILWTAAAKPFGYLNEEDRPNTYPLVLPAFRQVALIPVDASSAPSGGGYDLEWRRHVEDHLPDYMARGPQSASCWYCLQLQTWENETFRQTGIDWLDVNSYICTLHPPGGGGGSQGGGTRRGH